MAHTAQFHRALRYVATFWASLAVSPAHLIEKRAEVYLVHAMAIRAAEYLQLRETHGLLVNYLYAAVRPLTGKFDRLAAPACWAAFGPLNDEYRRRPLNICLT